MLYCKPINKILSLIYPNRCVCCKEIIEPNIFFCENCDNKISYRNPQTCPHCKELKINCLCNFAFDDIIAPIDYSGVGKSVILNIKKGGLKNAALFYGKIMAEEFLKVYSKNDFDFAVFVPSDKEKLKAKGYNHAQWIAKSFCNEVKIPLKKNIVLKKSIIASQHNLDILDRQSFALQSYYLAKTPPQNARIIIIDDIITTGATLHAISTLLKEKGVAKILCVTGVATELSWF